jgi:phosphoglycerate kinase
MTVELRTIEDLDVEDRRVLLRADFNVPLAPSRGGGEIRVADDLKIRAALPTLDDLRRLGARIVIVSHLDHPRGWDPSLSLRPVADRLAELTGTSVPVAPAVTGPQVRELIDWLEPGAMLMLENVRFEPGEVGNDPALAVALSELADLYVNDAFAISHRAYASTGGVAGLMPSAAGRLIERELSALAAIVERPARPLVAILGGRGTGRKLDLIRRFLDQGSVVCIGGEMCFSFVAADGHHIGANRCLSRDLEAARKAEVAAALSGSRLELASDLILGAIGATGRMETLELDGIDVPSGWTALDIGRRTAERYAEEIAAAATVFWNGPMGRIELPDFTDGTATIAQAIAAASATTVVAGDETVAALRYLQLHEHVSHVSTGGDAALEFLMGKDLPGVRGLRRSAGGMNQSAGAIRAEEHAAPSEVCDLAGRRGR